MIVLFDSGVWISAFSHRGVPLAAITIGLNKDTVLTCAELEGEVVRIMSKKFDIDPEITRQRLSELLEKSVRVNVTGKLSGFCRDPKDDFILECAETGGADLIVTGDKDVLSLASYGKTAIVTPRQYLDRAEDRPPCD